jgi:hypothetical protein
MAWVTVIFCTIDLLFTAGRLAIVFSCLLSTIEEAGRFSDNRGKRKVR